MSTNVFDFPNIGIFVEDLLEKRTIGDNDYMIVEDTENTKKIKLRNIKSSLISDNESPADFRLFSSQKVSQMCEEISKKFVLDYGSIEEDIENINRRMLTRADLDIEINRIDEKKMDKTAMDNIIFELEGTRKKSDKITGADIAYGTDAEKLHMQHLGSDILDAMTGHTQVSIPSVPLGGWTGDDMANGSIGAIKLRKDFSYRGNYIEGNLNRLVESGYYEVASTVEGVPHFGDDMDETRLLEVIRYGRDGKYIIQRVYYKEYTGIPRPYYERKGEFSKLSILEFVENWNLSNMDRIESALLGDHYNNRGALTNCSLFSVKSDGNYLCDTTVTGVPVSGFKYMVSVRSYDNRREFEAKTAEISGTKNYMCHEYYDANMVLHRTEWFITNDSTKSKFDGRKLHIFGDGISYGLGASNIGKLSFSSLLNSKYGWIIRNHSLTDATAGGYGDDIRSDSCVITQVEEANDLGEDQYALFYIGTEDWKAGSCQLGQNNKENDTTFKGSLNIAIRKLLEKCPTIKILFCTPIYRDSTESGDGKDGDNNMVNSKYLSAFVTSIKELTSFHHIPCVDLYNECMINKYNASHYLTVSGVFPNDRGHLLLAEKIQDAFNRYF